MKLEIKNSFKILINLIMFLLIDILYIYGNFCFVFTNSTILDFEDLFNIRNLFFIGFNVFFIGIKVSILYFNSFNDIKKSLIITVFSLFNMILLFAIIGVNFKEILFLASSIIIVVTIIYRLLYENKKILIILLCNLILLIYTFVCLNGSYFDFFSIATIIITYVLYIVIYIELIKNLLPPKRISINTYVACSLISLIFITCFLIAK